MGAHGRGCLARIGRAARLGLLVAWAAILLGGSAQAARASTESSGAAGAFAVSEEALSRSLGALGAAPSAERAPGFLGAVALVRESVPGISLRPSKTSPYWACPEGVCEEIIDPPTHRIAPRRVAGGATARFALPTGGPLAGRGLEGNGEGGGYDPQNLQSAYEIPVTGGADQTVALIDAGGFPSAEKDLAVYRERYGLPPCTHASGCFHKVNERGDESNYPGFSQGWESESALDMEMVSAACPECHILMVESSNEGAGLSEADATAARLGATEISNSWGLREAACGADLCEAEAADFDHPGVFVAAASGDYGYDNAQRGWSSPDFPASVPAVVAVGGTSLKRAENARGWSEEAWVDGGSGCSRFPKPAWQTDPACPGRMDADVAADAACESPVSIYDGHWENVCGTSVASPLVAGIEAHASAYARSFPGAEAFYQDPGAVFDVTKGGNGSCTPPKEDAYFCKAQVGYDGPTGNGSPHGPLPLNGTAPPIATSLPASSVSTTAATLNGIVDPDGQSASYRFEYGLTRSYGSSAPVPEGSLGSSGEHVSQSITGLSPESVYHYRLVTTSESGTSYGVDEEFTTAPPSVTSVTPDGGPGAGGTSVTITGANFIGTTAVKFGPSEAESFKVESETSITALAPEGSGPVQVTVISPGGPSATGAGDRFNYERPAPVLAWGWDHGLLGEGGGLDGFEPAEVSGLPEAVALAAGWNTNLAVLSSGRVMAWGENPLGTVGNGTTKTQSSPVGVCAVGVKECPNGPYLEEASAVAEGKAQSLALLKDGTVLAWGSNLFDPIGDETERSPVPVPVCDTAEAPCKPEHYLEEVKAIAAGAFFSLALLKNGTVVAWGADYGGQLGDGNTHDSNIPVPVKGLTGVRAIAAGWASGYALLEDGDVMAWGENVFGELGDATVHKSLVPKAVCAVGAAKRPCSALGEVTAIAGGAANAYALLRNGTVVAWGGNQYGELGDDPPGGLETCTYAVEGVKEKVHCSLAPLTVKNLDEVTAIASDAVDYSPLAELQSGELVSWGANIYGQLGDNAEANSETPVGVCQPYASEPLCPDGPYLGGRVSAMAAGVSDLVSFKSSPGPLLSDVQPDIGPAGGGTPVRITGTGFTGATAVDFGGTEAAEVRVESPDEIQAVTPPGAGAVEITVITPEGTSPATPADRFTYQDAPIALTRSVKAYGHNTAELSATVDPEGTAVTACTFEYGTTAGYESSVPCSTLPGAGTGPVEVTATLSGLAPGTSYHYRARATNEVGTGYGEDEGFSTLADLPGLPTIGRCVKRAGKPRSRYSNAACTTPSAGEDRGKYEWEGWPLLKKGFTGRPGGEIRTTGAHGWDIICSAELRGEYTGAQSALLSLTFKGCDVSGSEGQNACQSAGAASGEIRIATLAGELGFIKSEVREGIPDVSVGWLVHPASGEAVASFSCLDGGSWTVSGAIAGSIGPADEMSTSATLFLGDAEGFEGQPPSAMTVSGESGEEPVSFGSGGFITNEEAIELRALP